ncbi:MAG TPA: hypothetical protein VED46_06145 [Alphaproteobacteria bacterium]|nr:hypothetical protein [Alphaproteobacteria bacterium]
MGEPKQTNNVRRIDFAKAGTKTPRLQAGDTPGKPQESLKSGRDRLKVVSLPEARNRPKPKRQKTSHALSLMVIVLFAAILGALIAILVLDPRL